MKIGIMGGTFDPIHNGHLQLAESAYRMFGLDEIWFLPNGNPPHKDKIALREHIEDRGNMVRLAIENISYFRLCEYEMQRKERSYSYETMETLQQQYPEYEFYFIVGADSLFSLEFWKCPDRLLRVVTMLAAYRGEKDTEEKMNRQIAYLNQKFDGDIRLLASPMIAISSGEIRHQIAVGGYDTLKELPIPEKVAEYIKDKRLYLEA